MDSMNEGVTGLLQSYRGQAFNFFAAGVKETRRLLGPDKFGPASKHDPQDVREKFFDRADSRVSKAMLGPTYAVIDLENIVDGPASVKRINLYLALRTLFVLAAQALCEHSPQSSGHNGQRER